jgi:hypothetical protein
MQLIEQMFTTLPATVAADARSRAECVEACLVCESTCNACALACLAEHQVEALRRCIRRNLDCADIAGVMGRVLSRALEADDGVEQEQLAACARACAACAAECEQHARMHHHCRICADACRRCEEQCHRLRQRPVVQHG